MQFIVKYCSWKEGKKPYYRTIHANDIMEAFNIAQMYERKGYRYVSLTEKQ